MSSGGRHLDTLQVMKEEEDGFFSNLLSKEEDRISSSSSRVYYCNGAAVPFKWESRPGTPKRDFFSETSLPKLPLTPPPSYYSTKDNKIIKSANSKSNRNSPVDFLNLRNSKNQKKTKNNRLSPSFSWSPTTSYSLSSSSSSSSFSSSPVSKKTTKTRLFYDEDETGGNSPKTPFCFGSDSDGGFGNSIVKVKKALFSVLRK